MEIFVAKSAGFCFGVEKAVSLAKDVKKNRENVFTFGDIIHNTYVVNQLKEQNILAVSNLDQLKENDALVIRSHGVPKSIYQYLAQKKIHVYDATCPFVVKIHQIVEDHFNKGFHIIIIGQKDHDEVIGTNGYCNNSAIIIDSTSAAESIELDPTQQYCIVSQTTFSDKLYEDIIYIIKKRIHSLVIFDTICYTTKRRQKEAEDISKKCDTVFVIGCSSSSNTSKLFEICKTYCHNVYLIENLSDLSEINKKTISKLGITAGASTPNELIEEVIKAMSESQEKEIRVIGEETTQNSVKEAGNEEITMEDVVSSKEGGFMSYRAGKKIKAPIIRVDESGIFVNIGGKKDGFIDRADAEIDESFDANNYKIGEEIEAIIIENKNKKVDYITLSKKESDLKKLEDEIVQKALEGEEFSFACNKVVNKGLLGKLGSYTVFVPASQIRIGFVKQEDLEKYVGKKLRLKVLPEREEKIEVTAVASEENADETVSAAEVVNVDNGNEADDKQRKRNPKKITCSQRVVLEEERQEKEDEFWNSMVENEIVNGKVKRFASFGAFVNVKGFDCLAHISDLSWNKINDPHQILELNKNYDFLVLKVDRDTKHVSLGYKQLQKRPYEIAAEKYPIGSVIKGKVERIFPYGAFVSIDDGIDGLVHVSQISHKWLKNANEALKVGDEVEAKIINFEDNRITLSIKELLPPPEDDFEEQNQMNPDNIEATDEEREAKKMARAKKFENAKPSYSKKEHKEKYNNEEIKKWISNEGNATIGDLIGFVASEEETEKE